MPVPRDVIGHDFMQPVLSRSDDAKIIKANPMGLADRSTGCEECKSPLLRGLDQRGVKKISVFSFTAWSCLSESDIVSHDHTKRTALLGRRPETQGVLLWIAFFTGLSDKLWLCRREDQMPIDQLLSGTEFRFAV